jgi:agmatinase
MKLRPSYRLQKADPVFADCNARLEDAAYVFFGVPYDASVSHLSGASGAPLRIRKESFNFETFLMDIEVELDEVPMHDAGDLVLENTLAGQKDIQEHVRELFGSVLDAGRFPLMMGGEHSISIPSADAFMERFGSKGGMVLVIDAHLDFRDQYLDNPLSHACFARRVFDRWGKDSISIMGVRSGCAEEYRAAREKDLSFFTSRSIHNRGIIEAINGLDEAKAIRDRPIYLSIDIDGIDPAYAPGTGTPEPWGLPPWDVLQLIQELRTGIKAIDVNEISPSVEGYITPGLGAKILRQTVGLKEMKELNPTWLEKIL